MSDFVRDHISLYEDIDVEFNSLSEDHQDLADKFPKKTDRGFDREQAEIFHCYGMLKATKKSISLLQSIYLSIKIIDCII